MKKTHCSGYIEPYREKSTSAPNPWEKCSTQLKLAITANQNIRLENLLVARRSTLVYPTQTSVEGAVLEASATMEREGLTPVAQPNLKWEYECQLINHVRILC